MGGGSEALGGRERRTPSPIENLRVDWLPLMTIVTCRCRYTRTVGGAALSTTLLERLSFVSAGMVGYRNACRDLDGPMSVVHSCCPNTCPVRYDSSLPPAHRAF